MALMVTEIAADGIGVSIIGGAPAKASRVKAVGARMFVPIAILTEAELDSLISRAATSPGGLVHDLEDLRREFFR